MKLKQFTVREFRSIWDSGPIKVDDQVTCLVGKNEAGKTALLTALYRTNPIIPEAAVFDETYDHPKREVEDYRFAVENGNRDEAVIVEYPARSSGIRSADMRATIYGIKNCDTMKKARAWLDNHGIDYVFHDYKASGIERERLEGWSKKVGWEVLLNRAGTTFRALPEKDKQEPTEKKAIALMAAQPSMIKRPVLDAGRRLLVGFNPEQYERVFGARR